MHDLKTFAEIFTSLFFNFYYIITIRKEKVLNYLNKIHLFKRLLQNSNNNNKNKCYFFYF